ncbi:Uncharacterised protein [Klebsiella pneumoniae]|uniref:Uncharacterized protein n=1 Tax=Klebsiella pneumoniae TaxID=573 RepID=A0A377TJV5_KLEPN|nr:Uncharacterised protein [Klebsiella pneumoniae]
MKSPTLCQAAHSSARPNRQMSTTVTIRGALHLLGVITPFCIPRSGPMRSGLSLPLTASP